MRFPPEPKKRDPIERLLAQPTFESIAITIVPHCQAAPLGVLVRGAMEWLLEDAALERILEEHAPEQYTRELTIAGLVGLVTQVSAGLRRTVHAAYKADQAAGSDATISVSYQALYGKLGRMNPEASAALVRLSAARFRPLLELMPAAAEELPGFRLRILDGNVLTGTDHRLKPLRQWRKRLLAGQIAGRVRTGVGPGHGSGAV